MTVEMECGHCGSTISIDAHSEYDESLWSLTQRFCNAHVSCGYMTPAGQDDSETNLMTANIPVKRPSKRVLKSTDLVSDDYTE